MGTSSLKHVFAAQHGLSPVDLEHMLTAWEQGVVISNKSSPEASNDLSAMAAQETLKSCHTSATVKSAHTCISLSRREEVAERLRSAADFFGERPLSARVWTLFFAMHPCFELQQISLVAPSAVRALLLALRLLGALAASALFLENSGETLSWRHPADCVAEGMWAGTLQKVWLGLLSSLVATIPLVAVSALNRRSFIFEKDWTPERQDSYVRYWRRMDYILWIVGFLYVYACVFFIVCFLANITEEDQVGWMISAITTLVMTFILKPILLAGLHACAVTAAEVWKPEIMNKARLRLGIYDNKSDDDNQHVGPSCLDEDNADIDDFDIEEGTTRLAIDCEEGTARTPHAGKPLSSFFHRQVIVEVKMEEACAELPV